MSLSYIFAWRKHRFVRDARAVEDVNRALRELSATFMDVRAELLNMGQVWHEKLTVPTRIALVDVLNQILRSRQGGASRPPGRP